jgi:hypothetical protein
MLFEPELAPNQGAQSVLDFGVPGNRRFLSVDRVDVNVVCAAVSFQVTAGFGEFLQELLSFQTATWISLVWRPSTSGSISSSIMSA